jgi:Flp pilus assembly protein TadG
MMLNLQVLFKSWWRGQDALAATEAAMIFPIMLTLLLGVLDIGNGILANQKTIRASQVVADLIARNSMVNATDITEAIEAGRLAYEPIDTSSYGVDIISMRFTEDEEVEIVWRQTQNMAPIADPAGAVESLAAPNEGVVMVAVQYRYEPIFAGFVAHEIDMQERAFSRGRKSAVVNMN